MRKSLGLALFGMALLGAVWAADKVGIGRSSFRDAANGFSIDAPNFKDPEKKTFIPVIFTAPASNGFASNVNVMVQPQTTTREAYRDKSLAEMRQADFRIISDKDVTVSGKNAIRLEFDGEAQGKKLHWLTLVVIDKDRVILVTCTALADDFANVEADFKACLDSFKLDDNP